MDTSCPVCTVSLSLVCVALLVFIYNKRKKLNLPPGPPGKFLVGNAFQLTKRRHLDYEAMGKKYGDIVGITVFGMRVVILNSYDAIKEAFIDNAHWLSGRSKSSFQREFAKFGLGLVGSEGEIWKEHRRFTLSVLKDFGLGKSKIESTIQDELEYLRSELQLQDGRATDVKTILCKAVSNVVCSLVFSERCGQDSEFESVLQKINAITSGGPRSVIYYVVWRTFKHLPGDFTGLKYMLETRDYVHEYVRKRYLQHRQTFKPDNIRDYIDAFLYEMDKEDSQSRWFTGKFSGLIN